MVKQKNTPQKNETRQTHLSRLYFLNKGCKQAPLKTTGGRVLWANDKEGYFMNQHGMKLKMSYAPAMQKKGSKANNGKRGLIHPTMFRFGNKSAHRLMFETFADKPCPIYEDSKGKHYKGIVHHVIENPYDIRMDNLMGWLTYNEHAIADKRRRALEAVLPDMYCIRTIHLKKLEDPRETSDAEFEEWLNLFKEDIQ